MPEKIDINGARVIAHSILGYMSVIRGKSATEGAIDDRLLKSWVGKPLTNKLLVEAFDKSTAKTHRSAIKGAFSELERLQGIEGLSEADKSKIRAAYDALGKVIEEK